MQPHATAIQAHAGTCNCHAGTRNCYAGTRNRHAGTCNRHAGTCSCHAGTRNQHAGTRNHHAGTCKILNKYFDTFIHEGKPYVKGGNFNRFVFTFFPWNAMNTYLVFKYSVPIPEYISHYFTSLENHLELHTLYGACSSFISMVFICNLSYLCALNVH